MFFNGLQGKIEVKAGGKLRPIIRVVPGCDILDAIHQRVHVYGDATKIVLITPGPAQGNTAIFHSANGRHNVDLTVLENRCSLPVLVISRTDAFARWSRNRLNLQPKSIVGIVQWGYAIPGLEMLHFRHIRAWTASKAAHREAPLGQLLTLYQPALRALEYGQRPEELPLRCQKMTELLLTLMTAGKWNALAIFAELNRSTYSMQCYHQLTEANGLLARSLAQAVPPDCTYFGQASDVYLGAQLLEEEIG